MDHFGSEQQVKPKGFLVELDRFLKVFNTDASVPETDAKYIRQPA
jgi:hypothetical protein